MYLVFYCKSYRITSTPKPPGLEDARLHTIIIYARERKKERSYGEASELYEMHLKTNNFGCIISDEPLK